MQNQIYENLHQQHIELLEQYNILESKHTALQEDNLCVICDTKNTEYQMTCFCIVFCYYYFIFFCLDPLLLSTPRNSVFYGAKYWIVWKKFSFWMSRSEASIKFLVKHFGSWTSSKMSIQKWQTYKVGSVRACFYNGQKGYTKPYS